MANTLFIKQMEYMSKSFLCLKDVSVKDDDDDDVYYRQIKVRDQGFVAGPGFSDVLG